MTPFGRIARREPLALERQQSRERRKRRVDPVGGGQLVGPHALGAQHRGSPRVLLRALRRAGLRPGPPRSRAGRPRAPCPRGLPAAYVGEPGRPPPARRPRTRPASTRRSGCRSPCASLGVLNDWMLSEASSRSVRRDRPVAAHCGGESIATTSGRRSRIRRSTSGTRTCENTCRGTRRSSRSTRSSPLPTPTSIPSERTPSALGLPPVGEEVQQVAPGQHAEHLALPWRRARRARAPVSANADSIGWSHSTMGIGGAMTSATSACRASGSRKTRSSSSRSRIEPTNCVTSAPSSRTTGAWEMSCSLQHVDGLPDLRRGHRR